MKSKFFLLLFTLSLQAYAFADFTDNGNNTVSDSETNLMWQKLPEATDHVLRDREAAIKYCEELDFADYDDWRLPDRPELQSLIDDTRDNPAIDVAFFPNTKDTYYWSSSPDEAHANYGWGISFYFGDVGSNKVTNNHYARCTRSG